PMAEINPKRQAARGVNKAPKMRRERNIRGIAAEKKRSAAVAGSGKPDGGGGVKVICRSYLAYFYLLTRPQPCGSFGQTRRWRRKSHPQRRASEYETNGPKASQARSRGKLRRGG